MLLMKADVSEDVTTVIKMMTMVMMVMAVIQE